jgi:hypothetical protein
MGSTQIAWRGKKMKNWIAKKMGSSAESVDYTRFW